MVDSIIYLLCAVSAALFVWNVSIYRINRRYRNSDIMGAMQKWHMGFAVTCVPLAMAAFTGKLLPWWSGFVVILLIPVASFVLWFSVDKVLELIGLIGREKSPKTFK